MVKNNPATDSGIARVIAVLLASAAFVVPPFKARAMIIADATDAKAASGAIAAPTFDQPRANICSAPPSMTPSFKCPVTSPIKVQATNG